MKLLKLAVVAGIALSACSSPGQAPAPERLSAELVTPIEVRLNWRADEPGAAGRIVEFATEPRGKFTILQFMPPSQTTYTHPDLMPETPFYYRVRPFYGPVSETVEVTLPPGDFDEKDQQNDHEWAPPKALPEPGAVKQPIRGTAGGAPAGLTAEIMHANGIKFTWADRASDEEGYLLEVKPEGAPDFREVTVLDPDINSVGLITMPDEKKATYRVRAFYYGPESNVVHETTGKDPLDR
ncbi:fibronectin type III domain-containing protein [Amycolatopsis sp. cg5]|uniref:fibronectin type III domain-containing protein n=1 Tax=Amycolatopsis sp. cg5 TaxID=3238802 RepID=UPI003523B6FE